MHSMRRSEKAEALFWAKVDRSGDCWEWTACKRPNGYGNVMQRQNKKSVALAAHRVAWQLTHGEMPVLCVLHRCDNRACVNPDHLFLGTKADNTTDMIAKGRKAIQYGEDASNSRLTEHGVRLIRQMCKAGISQNEVGRRLGFWGSHINSILHGRRWGHVK
jgi:hypothetical protein